MVLDIHTYAVLDQATPHARALFQQFQPVQDESVIVIAVFVILLLLLPGLVAVALAQVFPPAHPAHPVPPAAFDPLFWIIQPDIVSVQSTNTLNHAGLYVAPPAIVRLL